MEPSIFRSKSFVSDATDFIIKKATESHEERGRFILGLCGGKTPEPVYTELANRGQLLNWSRIFITFGDERCVGPDHSESNYLMAKKSLLDKIGIPPQNISRIHGEDSPESAAIDYEKHLLLLKDESAGIMRHDLLLLGVGDDGHTASLFPETSALAESNRLVVPNFVPKFNGSRITYTYKTINASRHVCFLVNDPRKETVISEIWKGNPAYPATGVRPTESLTWLLGF